MENNKDLFKLLKPDNEVIIENLKSIIDKEQDYQEFLYYVEETVIGEYLKNKKITDNEIITNLNNFLSDVESNIITLNSDFKRRLYANMMLALEEKSITKHEIKLCLRYILWSINNRSWLNDSQAYVKWLTHAAGVMTSSEKKAYEIKTRKFCEKNGIPKKQMEAILTNNFDEIDEGKESTIESQYYATDEDKKLDFVLNNFEQATFIGEYYYNELLEKKDYDAAEKLCKMLLDKMPEFPPIETLLGILYKEKGNKILAKIHFKHSIKTLNETPITVIPEKETMIKVNEKLIKELGE